MGVYHISKHTIYIYIHYLQHTTYGGIPNKTQLYWESTIFGDIYPRISVLYPMI